MKKYFLIILLIFPINFFSEFNEDYLSNEINSFLVEVKSEGKSSEAIKRAFSELELLKDSKTFFYRALKLGHLQDLTVLLQEDNGNPVLVRAKQLLILKLYELFFLNSVDHIISILNQISFSKDYLDDRIHSGFSIYFRKLIDRSFCKLGINRRVFMLTQSEGELCLILGMMISALHEIKLIKDRSGFMNHTTSTLKLFDYFNIRCSSDLNGSIESLVSLSESIVAINERNKRILKSYGVPNHFQRNGRIYISMTIVGLAAAFYCKRNKERFQTFSQDGKKAFFGLVDEYLMQPLKDLKEAIWDQPEVKLNEVPTDNTPSSWWGCTSPEKTVKFLAPGQVENYNSIVRLLAKIAKRQRINYCLLSTVPIFVGAYFSSKYLNKAYVRKSLIDPVQKIVHEIDILLNRDYKFEEIGKLYFYGLQLKDYLSVMSLKDRKFMNHDIDELLSFSFSCQQKQRIVERMYRMYPFLSKNCT